ncbi:MAG TPA: c-type cytochrome [Acetobacteraceae bacterium]|nr:c-type cytochrome [Acetobacteraceae bacterium]
MTDTWQHEAAGVTLTLALAAFIAMLFPFPVRAAVPPGEQLFQNNDCVTCHAVDHKIVGPSFEDVAKKFAGQPNAVPTLVDAVKNGHVGTWGMVPMPPHPNLSDAQITEIVNWILTLK